MPLIGLLAFVIWPWPQALAVYSPVALVSLALFYTIYRSMKQPLTVGREALVGRTGDVISKGELGSSVQYLVRCRGESWVAKSGDTLAIGDQVRILSLEGVRLVVERVGPAGQNQEDR